MSGDVYEVLKDHVNAAIKAWAEWLEAEAGAEDFRSLFKLDPYVGLIEEGTAIWKFSLAAVAQDPLALRLHRERGDRRRREREAAREDLEAETQVVEGLEEEP